MQRIRLHNGHTQEGCQLHKEKSRPEFIGGTERCHIDINVDEDWRPAAAILNMIPILRLSDFIVFNGFVGYF